MDLQLYVQISDLLSGSQLLTPEEVPLLREVMSHVLSPRLNVREALLSHSKLQMAAGFFLRRAQACFRHEQHRLEDLWNAGYEFLKNSSESRVTEAAADAYASSVPEYTAQRAKVLHLQYISDQLSDLHAALITHGRMLEQVSNNDRQVSRESLEER